MVRVELERDLATLRSVLELWPEAVQANYRAIAEHTGRPVMPVLKSDAYGLGLGLVYRALRDLDPPWIGVANPWEGVRLRRLGYRGRILVLSGFLPEEVPLLQHWDLTPAVYHVDQLTWLHIAGTPRVRFHLKVDTGMGRLGVRWDEVDGFIAQYRRYPELEMEGVFSNLACADQPDHPLTHQQIARFRQVCALLEDAGIPIRWRHLANSAGIQLWPEAWFDLVRPGLALYGWQLPGSPIAFRLAVRWWARVLQVRQLDAGWTIGYGARYVLPRNAWVAVVGVGYFDGYDRRMSPDAWMVSAHGVRLRVLGTISMDLTVVAVPDGATVRPGDPVLLFGAWRDQQIGFNHVAEWCRTAPHEVFSRIGPRVSRRLVRNVAESWPMGAPSR